MELRESGFQSQPILMKNTSSEVRRQASIEEKVNEIDDLKRMI
jgi:hypothetical protein